MGLKAEAISKMGMSERGDGGRWYVFSPSLPSVFTLHHFLRPSAVLYKPNWEGELRRVLNSKVVAHELSHFWFGNLVTPRWWDALWLSEGAATFFASLILNKVGSGQFPVPPITFKLYESACLKRATNGPSFVYKNQSVNLSRTVPLKTIQ